MDKNKKPTIYTATEARKNLYSILRDAATGLSTYEIHLQGFEPVVLINKNELESWNETLEILMNEEERKTISKAKKEKNTITHTQLLKELGLDDTSV